MKGTKFNPNDTSRIYILNIKKHNFCQIYRSEPLDKPKGFAFVDLMDHASALQAVSQLNGMELGGRTLNSSLRKKDFVKADRDPADFSARPRTDRDRPPRVEENPERTVYVSNINWSLTKVSIENMCEDLLGKNLLENVRFPVDREKGTSRGFCYITFKSSDDAERAIRELNGVEVLGRLLNAKKYEARAPGGYDQSTARF